MAVKILPCTCGNTYQDAKYGKGQRVHNQTKTAAPEAQRRWRCTVCGKEQG